MSGIVGIVNFDGAPVDAHLVGRMTEFMTFRGPDAQKVWSDGHVGFGHTLLKTTDDTEHERQPFTLDGRVWIVADARIDARRDLIASLHGKRHEDLIADATDVELIARAYHTWGERCVEHLLGDFAFAIWDGTRKQLFCARDHLGIKPLYFAQLGTTIIISNTLDCVRQHPKVSDELNETAIADFLLFGMNQEPGTTTFAAIQRIPPAHCATWSPRAELRLRQYWTLPIDEPLFLRRHSDYTDRFLDLLENAVSDRLRTKTVGIFMSGGLDSTSLAAMACRILHQRSHNFEVSAFTSLIDGVRDNKEEFYAGLVAEHLGIPIHYRDLRGKPGFATWDALSIATAEPVSDPASVRRERAYYRELAACCRVCFFGEGPDNALHYEWQPYLSYLRDKRRYGRLFFDVSDLAVRHRRIPLLSSLPHRLRERRREQWQEASFPEWLDSGFESRLRLRSRWEEMASSSAAESPHPVRPLAYNSFNSVLWEALFHGFDAEQTRAAIEVRHPFVDLRLMRYMLSVPAIPWCRVKYLIRKSMRQMLPSQVLSRPKAPITNENEQKEQPPYSTSFTPSRLLARYVDMDQLTRNNNQTKGLCWRASRVQALNHWLLDVNAVSFREVHI
jgi:asparagine synthase (glutamine-hydrolysing)